MRIAIIGRTELLYNSSLKLNEAGHDIVCIVTAKEAPEYRRTAEDFRTLAASWQIPYAKGSNIIEYSNLFRDVAADIAVSVNYTGIVPQSVIDLFPQGILNAHGGDLPRYRGNACQAWAIINGEERIGLCIHRMIGGKLDSGDIISRDYLPIDHHTKVTKVWEWMMQRTPELFIEAVERLAKDPAYVLERQSKDPKDAMRCYPRKPEDGRIDWNKTALDVLRLINATNKPYAGAFCEFEGEKFIIWDAELVREDENFLAVPGQITLIGEKYIEVACRDSKLRILSAEYNGLKNPPNVWIKSIRKRLQ